jgi:hypothetical protein
MARPARPNLARFAALPLLALLLAPGERAAASAGPWSTQASAAPRTALAGWSFFQPDLRDAIQRPHPAVARIVVPEGNATSYGSGTLIDARGEFGLVVTNWHVVRDGHGDIEVVFPDGFRSKARAVKVDSDWDLAALVIWRPPAPPVTIARQAPQPGDQLTICGYGSGQYRSATGRCTQYYAPAIDLPQDMVELDVEARQGDSGGPIFNDRGELAGVLFGAGHGTTMGSFGGRVGTFLAELAPNIGVASTAALAADNTLRPTGAADAHHAPVARDANLPPASPPLSSVAMAPPRETLAADRNASAVRAAEASPGQLAVASTTERLDPPNVADGWHVVSRKAVEPRVQSTRQLAGQGAGPPLFDHARSALAVIGLLTLALQAVRLAS